MSGHLIWITGLAGSGKTTLAKEVYKRLYKKHNNIIHIDGDEFREIMMNENGFSQEERLSNARKIAKLCSFLTNQNMIVISSTVSLFHEIHQFNNINNTNYTEVFIKVSMEELIRRDKKGLYSRALEGKLNNVMGIDIPYEDPKKPTLTLDNSKQEYFSKNVLSIINTII